MGDREGKNGYTVTRFDAGRRSLDDPVFHPLPFAFDLISVKLQNPPTEDVALMARQRELLSLLQISEETGISYPTLRKYVAEHGDEIPSEGEGRQTRYPRAAVRVFQRLRSQSKPGRKPKAERLEAQAPADDSISTHNIPSVPSIQRPAAEPRLFQKAPVQPERPEPRREAAREATMAGTALPAEVRDDLRAIRGALETISRHLEKGVGLLALLVHKPGQPEAKPEKAAETAKPASPPAVSPAPAAAASPAPAPPAPSTPPAPIPAAARLEIERPERPESFGPYTVRHGRSAAHRVTLGPKVRGKAGPRPE
jgi:hypothetical protein